MLQYCVYSTKTIMSTLIENKNFVCYNNLIHTERVILNESTINPMLSLQPTTSENVQNIIINEHLSEKEMKLNNNKQDERITDGITTPSFNISHKTIGNGNWKYHITTITIVVRFNPNNKTILKTLL